VTLTVTDSGGQTSAPVSRSVTVYAPPQAGFTIAGNGALEGSPLSFNAGPASSPGTGGPIVRYAWTFSDGTTASGLTTSHVFPRPGSYPVTLTVTNAVGLSNSVTEYVTIGDEAPLAAPRLLTRTPLVGSTVAFDGTSSHDSDGRIVAWAWTFGDGATASGARPTHRYRWAGPFTVTLTVVGSDGERASQTMRITVLVPGRVTRVQARQATGGPTLIISVNGPGRLSVGGRKVRVHGPGSTRWQVRLSAAQLRALAAHRTIQLRTAIAFTPDVGTPSRRTYTMSLRRPVHARRYTVQLR
jgi:PKD repeat protein